MLYPPPASTRSEIDAALSDLKVMAGEWTILGVDERLGLLREMRDDFLSVGEQWVQAEMAAKGLTRNTIGEAEEWVFLAGIFRSIRMLERSLQQVQKYGQIRLPRGFTSHGNSQLQLQVFPTDWWDRVLFRGIKGHVRFNPGKNSKEITEKQSYKYQGKNQRKGTALVLGAGNAGMLPVVDILHCLFVEKQVVAFKPNPINAHLGPLIERGMNAFVRRGYMKIFYGGAEVGSYLACHADIDELHMTGSHRTYEKIVFGSGQEGLRRKKENILLNSKPFICELGNISPVIILPGPWSIADLREQAEQLATWFTANASFGCLTPRVLILEEGWIQRPLFLEMLGEILVRTPTRKAFYPGAHQIHSDFLERHTQAITYGVSSDGRLPWTIVQDVDPSNKQDICFTQEAFCSLCAETALAAPDPASFLDRAVNFANDVLWGNLSAMLIVHPKSMEDPVLAEAVERAVDRLQYGTVAVNHFSFASYYMQVLPWGGYPGNTPQNIQSGLGRTANSLLLGKVEKSVLWAPFYKRPDPVRVTRLRSYRFARRLAYFEAHPTFENFFRLAWQLKEA